MVGASAEELALAGCTRMLVSALFGRGDRAGDSELARSEMDDVGDDDNEIEVGDSVGEYVGC